MEALKGELSSSNEDASHFGKDCPPLVSQDSLVDYKRQPKKAETFATCKDSSIDLVKVESFKTPTANAADDYRGKLIMIDTTDGRQRPGNLLLNDEQSGVPREIEPEGEDGVENYETRVQLPILRDPNDRPSVWRILKSAIGKDLGRFGVPVYLNEPISMI